MRPAAFPSPSRIVAETWGLLSPRECSCGAAGTRLCTDCAVLLDPVRAQRVDHLCDALQVLPAAPGEVLEERFETVLPVLALGQYRDRLRALVLGWKNGGRLHLTDMLGAMLAQTATRLPGAPPAGRTVQLLSVPSTWAARVRRGEDHARELARSTARHHDGAVLGAPLGAFSRTQSGRDAHDRRERLLVRRPWTPRLDPKGPPAVIVDDVVTTGGTLRAARDAVRAGGGPPVLGAVVLASARWPDPHGPGGGTIPGMT